MFENAIQENATSPMRLDFVDWIVRQPLPMIHRGAVYADKPKFGSGVYNQGVTNENSCACEKEVVVKSTGGMCLGR